ncbi:MAG: CPBP family glutamic-type intramembrane protease [Tenuifilum sp.]|uniref:CPBP family glutamic-type intramembrane protease n=1 Tax=Tenuifilum sp. TaxID=2760880 RepID=UPI0016B2415A|nr:CPBP family intramembrane metalloprotease [bacterium]HQG72456.1 CPBP family glutamic-type intramembrane protease [Tenuifilum sp.]
MSHFIEFLKKPYIVNKQNKIDWKYFFTLLFSYYLILLPVGVFIKIINSIFNITQKQVNLELFPKIVLALFIVPIIEELLFRLILIINKRNLIIFSSITLILSTYNLLKSNYYFSIILFTLSILAVLFLSRSFEIRSIITKYYSIYFYAIAIIFGLMHFKNYNGIDGFLYLWIPFLVFPQILMGAFFGYIRIKFGIIYSIIFHMIINLFAIGTI